MNNVSTDHIFNSLIEAAPNMSKEELVAYYTSTLKTQKEDWRKIAELKEDIAVLKFRIEDAQRALRHAEINDGD